MYDSTRDYRMLVLGLDGILLGRDKGLRHAAVPLIRRALDGGKCVVLSSCRVMAELFDYCGNDDLGCIPYAILSMGTELYDFRGEGLARIHLLPSTMVRRVLEVTAGRDVVLHVVKISCQKFLWERMAANPSFPYAARSNLFCKPNICCICFFLLIQSQHEIIRRP